jgi:hypothetical protein
LDIDIVVHAPGAGALARTAFRSLRGAIFGDNARALIQSLETALGPRGRIDAIRFFDAFGPNRPHPLADNALLGWLRTRLLPAVQVSILVVSAPGPGPAGQAQSGFGGGLQGNFGGGFQGNFGGFQGGGFQGGGLGGGFQGGGFQGNFGGGFQGGGFGGQIRSLSASEMPAYVALLAQRLGIKPRVARAIATPGGVNPSAGG